MACWARLTAKLGSMAEENATRRERAGSPSERTRSRSPIEYIQYWEQLDEYTFEKCDAERPEMWIWQQQRDRSTQKMSWMKTFYFLKREVSPRTLKKHRPPHPPTKTKFGPSSAPIAGQPDEEPPTKSGSTATSSQVRTSISHIPCRASASTEYPETTPKFGNPRSPVVAHERWHTEAIRIPGLDINQQRANHILGYVLKAPAKAPLMQPPSTPPVPPAPPARHGKSAEPAGGAAPGGGRGLPRADATVDEDSAMTMRARDEQPDVGSSVRPTNVPIQDANNEHAYPPPPWAERVLNFLDHGMDFENEVAEDRSVNLHASPAPRLLTAGGYNRHH